MLSEAEMLKEAPWRHGAVDIASTEGTEDPGSNPDKV
jgi:hypothetical protein